MAGVFGVTFPLVPLTGKERSVSNLAQPDERNIFYRLDETNVAHRLGVEALQAPFLTAETQLPVSMPQPLRDRIAVCRQLAVYGYFCYEFHAVSMFWSISSIEMALKLKFRELNPGPIRLRRYRDGVDQGCEV